MGGFVIAWRLRTAFHTARVLATMALLSAIMLGYKLSHREMEAPIKEWLSNRHPATFPHGRSICYRPDHKYIARKPDRH